MKKEHFLITEKRTKISSLSMVYICHGGTTEESNYSYLLPNMDAPGQVEQVWDEFVVFPRMKSRVLVRGMDMTWSKLRVNAWVLECLVRETWLRSP